MTARARDGNVQLLASKPAKPGKHLFRIWESLRKRLVHLRYGHSRGVAEVHWSSVTNRFPRPNFIIIGAPKCGTSWLQRALGQHPDIIMVPNEIEYFSMHLDYPVEWYLNHFARAKRESISPSHVPHVLGEKSARYCAITPDRVALVRRLLPDVRLILMTRDPVARHWSQAKRFFSKQRFNKREGGVFGVPKDELFDFFEQMRPLSEFSRMIARWTTIYSEEQLL